MITPGQMNRTPGHRESRGHYHVGELDGLPRRARLNDLSKVDRATFEDFTPPVARLYIRQFDAPS
jgi:hypothetical protein